ncbi:transcriptional regulator, SARP family protein [Saccharothrix sp. ALI-22-I]|uniref:AfsR/SARP family transcriptional regulator n=1 Tax=Saccharothrix sp. ALI-22-I TaxID=1933778 RepID=UPI00097C1CDF|nr:transcriptional regulator, SARP family protein [Saccharothrix sp. ALI-22-I]
MLAALAVDAGRVVPVDRLIDRVWGDDPPLRARTTLLNYLSRLRLLLASAGTAVVARRPGGYSLDVERFTVDLLRFHDLCAQARTGDDRQAAALLRQALDLWQGEALTGIEGDWAEAERYRLHQQLLGAECDLTDTLLRLGHGEDLVATLSARTVRWPLDERVASQLMLALHRAGRTADALAHYRALRDRLVEHLGTEPGTALQDLHQRILDTDPTLTPPLAAITGAAITSGTAAKAEPPVPRQLPAPPRWFTGRGTELARLDQALTAGLHGDRLLFETGSARQTATTVVISAIGGTGGIGKTWLALAWAHRHLDRFPDGQLFIDLHGFSPTEEPMAPESAVHGFLDALGVASGRIPPNLDAQAALYRSLVAGKRMLVVLDNAATVDQVVPLLPGSPTCTVLVTGRTRLASLIDRHGARHLQLDILDRVEARALLAARLGADRAEADAVDELVELCGGYPLALSITARVAASRPGIPLTEIAAELRELGLEMLDHDTDSAASLPDVLSWSLRWLTDEQRTVFGLLGIAPGPDTTLPAVVSLTGLPPARARKALATLENASLLERRPGGRYAMHDLVRTYAASIAHDLPDDVREAALVRVMDFHLHTAHTADHLLEPTRQHLEPDPPAPGVHPHPLHDAAAATAWLQTEHANLLATQRAAVVLGHHPAVWHLAQALESFHYRSGHLRDALAMWRAAVDAAAHLPDPATRSGAHRALGYAYARLGLHEEATDHLDQALDLAVRHDDPTQQAHIHRTLAAVWERRGEDQRALDHVRQALNLHRALGQPEWEAHALCGVGWFAARLGDFDTARDHCRAALTLYRHHDNPDGEADALDSLGFIAHRTGHYQQAVGHYHQALTLYRTVDNRYQLADSLDRLGHPHAALGQHEQASTTWREALGLYREQGRDEDAERVQQQLDDLDRDHSITTATATASMVRKAVPADNLIHASERREQDKGSG